MRSSPRRLAPADLLLAIYAVCCAAALTWPGYIRPGRSIEPYVLGLPFSLAWVVGWVVLTFVVLAVYHVVSERRRKRVGGD